MSAIGVEVGQKMRSAIKAKLTELDCYVDDELPDYIMVMIANKRTKSQMKDDLQLFLSSKTSTFVDWLHIVLKKLKEVHVTNPDVFKKPVKRKSSEFVTTEEDFKKIKKEKKDEAKALKRARKEAKASKEMQKSLTDDLPITANKLSEARKIVVMKENQLAQSSNSQSNHIDEDSFDIPLLSEISASNEEELELIERKIKNVKSRLGLHVESDDEDCLNIKPDPDDLLLNDQLKKSRQSPASRNVTIEVEEDETAEKSKELEPSSPENDDAQQKSIHTRITFDKEKDSLNAKYAAILSKYKEEHQQKRKSVLDRLGKRPHPFKNTTEEKRIKNNSIERKEEDVRKRINNKLREKDRRENKDKPKEGMLSRLGVMSKVSIPPKRPKTPEQPLDEEEELKRTQKEVPSVIKIKPRILPPKAKQANPNLLFKAVAEAQRSVSLLPIKSKTPERPVKTSESTALFTKKYKEKLENKFTRKAKLLEDEKLKLKILVNNSVEDNNSKARENEESAKQTGIKYTEDSHENGINAMQKFIVTLDGIEKPKFTTDESKSIVKIRRTPSPIIFTTPKVCEAVPEKLPIAPIKNKEKCKYWPGCRQGDKCDFVHPSMPCKMFPNCKFDDKCVYIHPICKFETSCTRRDCPYSHTGGAKSTPKLSMVGSLQKPVSQICKFFPNCSNVHCTFYHPRLCKFGVFCKNQTECNFVHSFSAKAGNLTWRSEK